MLETTIRCLVRPHASNNGTVKTADTRRLLLSAHLSRSLRDLPISRTKVAYKRGIMTMSFVAWTELKLLVSLKKTKFVYY